MTILLRRGTYETLASGQSATAAAVAPNDFRLPADHLGARIAWQTIGSGVTGTPTFALQATLDGVNWTTLDTSTSLTGEVRVVISQGVLGVRFAVTVTGTAGTVTALVRAA